MYAIIIYFASPILQIILLTHYFFFYFSHISSMLPCIAHCCESFPSGRKDEIWSAFIYPGIHVRFLDSWYTKMCHVVHAILDSVLRTGVLVLRSWWRRSIIAKINKKSAINPNAQGRHLRLVGNNTNKMDVNIFSSELKITALHALAQHILHSLQKES